jgi:methylated-DNA-[protein]-cysteine S-methyltransferase
MKTPFSRRVLAVLRRIPVGCVATYGDVARLAGRPGAARAVGNIMREAAEPGLPCHRVVAAGGRLGGFGGRPDVKLALLAAEGHRFRQRRLIDFRASRWPGRDAHASSGQPSVRPRSSKGKKRRGARAR